MAKRIELICVTNYDNDGGLSWSWNGSQWLEWYEWRRGQGVNMDVIAQDLRDHFEIALASALDSGEAKFSKLPPWGVRK
jgi:hypothetical protein